MTIEVADDEEAYYVTAHESWRPAARRLQSARTGARLCPICGYRGGAFAAFGSPRRPHAQCPRCGSVERHRFLWLFLERLTDLLRHRPRLLHCAAEPALVPRLRRQLGRGYVTVDKFDAAADHRADLAALPFPAASFDAAISSHVLEHIPDDRAAMRELARVLRPGGWAVVMVPYDPGTPTNDMPDSTPAERLAINGHPYHYRTYGPDLAERLVEAGFEVTLHRSRTLLTGHVRRRHRINANTLFFCRRRPA